MIFIYDVTEGWWCNTDVMRIMTPWPKRGLVVGRYSSLHINQSLPGGEPTDYA